MLICIIPLLFPFLFFLKEEDSTGWPSDQYFFSSESKSDIFILISRENVNQLFPSSLTAQMRTGWLIRLIAFFPFLRFNWIIKQLVPFLPANSNVAHLKRKKWKWKPEKADDWWSRTPRDRLPETWLAVRLSRDCSNKWPTLCWSVVGEWDHAATSPAGGT